MLLSFGLSVLVKKMVIFSVAFSFVTILFILREFENQKLKCIIGRALEF